MSGRKTQSFKFRSKYDTKNLDSPKGYQSDEEWEDDKNTKSASWSPFTIILIALVALAIIVLTVCQAKGVDVRDLFHGVDLHSMDHSTDLILPIKVQGRPLQEKGAEDTEKKAFFAELNANVKETDGDATDTDTKKSKDDPSNTDTGTDTDTKRTTPIAIAKKTKKEPKEGKQLKESELMEDVNQQIEKIRDMKFKQHIVIETSEEAQREVKILQDLLRALLPIRYGPEPYIVDMKVGFPQTMLQAGNWSAAEPQFAIIPIKMAPMEHVPYCTFYFLENIVKNFKKGSFHRRASHVLQAMIGGGNKAAGFAFQEYSKEYPHKKYTLGYAGRPSSAHALYISTMDNSGNHGPGSQGSKTEADGIIGEILTQQGIDVVTRMQQQPGAGKGAGFVSDSKNFIEILDLTLRPAKQ